MTKERSLLMEVGKHVWEKSITLPPELAARILDWYREPPDEPNPAQAPIAKITVRESGAGHYAPDDVSVSLYAPGLPPGEHDVYCEPMSVAPALKSECAHDWRVAPHPDNLNRMRCRLCGVTS